MSNNSRRGFSPVLAFILGFVLALVITVGSVAGVAVIALNYKIDKLSANKDSDGNYLYINADANNGGVSTVLDLVRKLTDMSKDFGSLSLGEVEELVPVVSKLTDALEDALKQFVTLEEGELEAVKFSELSDFINGLMDKVDLVSLLDAPPSNPILVYMCLGVTAAEYDADADLWKAKYKDADGNVYDSVIRLDENGKVESGYYINGGGEEVALEGINLDNVKQRANGVTKDLTLGEILKIDDGDRILGAVKNSTIDTLADDFNKISIQQLFTEDIYALTEADGETKRDVLWYEAAEGATPTPAATYNPDFIYYTYDGDSGEYRLAGGWGKLKADEFDASKHYTLGEGKILFDKAFIYYSLTDGDYVMVEGEDKGRLTSTGGDTYYTYGSPTPLWKLLLSVEMPAGSGEKVEQVYAVNNITEMINNVTKNTQGTQMRELHAAGILVFEDPTELENELVWYETKSGGVREEHREKIGDMTLIEVIETMLYISKNPTALIPTPVA